MICSFDGDSVCIGCLLLGVYLLVRGCVVVGEEKKWDFNACGWVRVGGGEEEDSVVGKAVL